MVNATATATERVLKSLVRSGRPISLDQVAHGAGICKTIRVVSALHALHKRGSVARTNEDGKVLFFITSIGTKEFDNLRHARRAASAERAADRTDALAAANEPAKPKLSTTITIARDQLRAMAAAALASPLPLNDSLRAACVLAVQEAA